MPLPSVWVPECIAQSSVNRRLHPGDRAPLRVVGDTPSLDAFQAYARGLLQFRRGLWLQAVPFLERATELDPEFAMAFQVLSHAYWNAGERRRSAEYSRAAFALIDRVSERERLAISAIYYIRVTGEAQKITDALELFQQRSSAFHPSRLPRRFSTPWGNLRSGTDFERAVRLDPAADTSRD